MSALSVSIPTSTWLYTCVKETMVGVRRKTMAKLPPQAYMYTVPGWPTALPEMLYKSVFTCTCTYKAFQSSMLMTIHEWLNITASFHSCFTLIMPTGSRPTCTFTNIHMSTVRAGKGTFDVSKMTWRSCAQAFVFIFVIMITSTNEHSKEFMDLSFTCYTNSSSWSLFLSNPRF